jgi:hypothetical protein
LFLGFLQRSQLLLLTRDVAVQRRDLRALTEQLSRRRRESECECGNHNCEHGGASGERRLAATRAVTIAAVRHVTCRCTNGSCTDSSCIADVRRSAVVCGRTAAGQRQPTTNRGNADAPA